MLLGWVDRSRDAVPVMSCSGLPWGLDMNKDVGIQVCVRERIIWPNGQEEISYGEIARWDG
eukprot:768279-Hanusia_phi.AAC.6